MKKLVKPIALFILTALCLTSIVSAEGTSGLVAENMEITTYRGVSAGGKLSASSPDGRELKYEIVTPPTKGSIDLNEDGSFVYTPDEGRKGKDYFGFKATDIAGNSTQEGTVIIRIKKQKTKVTYSDLHGDECGYAATALAEQGIFVGENIAGAYVFSPDTAVTRSEFLTMCMKLTDEDILTGVTSTGFADDAEIQPWLKPYISTALSCGLISGYSSTDKAAVFNADKNITAAEAAVMLDRALELSDVSAVSSIYEEAVPAWACQSTANAAACGLIPHGLSLAEPELTRTDAAQMLVSAMEIINKR